MSDFAATGALVGLIIANAFVFVYMDAWVQNRSDAIITGVIRGVPVSVKHRRYLLQTRFLIHGAALISIEGCLVIGWMVVGRNAGVEELKLIAYLAAFVNATAVLGWTLLFPFWYLHLASVLREAEAD
jgi:hypothetical protein